MTHARWMLALAFVLSALPARADHLDECVRASDEGQHLRKDGKLSAAAQKFAMCSGAVCPAAIRRDCARWVDEVDALTPTVVFAATDAHGRDRFDVTVFVDGVRVGERLDGRPVPLDPGVHSLRYVGSDRVAATEDLVARAGEKNRIVSMALASAVPPAPPPPEATRRPVPPLAIALAGVAVIGLGGATYFDLSATSDANTLRDTCAPRCAHTDVDAVENKYRVAGVAVGTGIIAAGIAAYLFFTR